MEAASWIRNAGNAAFNASYMELAMRKYSKALRYCDVALQKGLTALDMIVTCLIERSDGA